MPPPEVVMILALLNERAFYHPGRGQHLGVV